eukprot:278971-Prymnesium_polylepis.1
MPDATLSSLFDRSIVSVGLTPRSSSMGSRWPSTLQVQPCNNHNICQNIERTQDLWALAFSRALVSAGIIL